MGDLITKNTVKKWMESINSYSSIIDKTNVSGMVLGNSLYKFVNSHCDEDVRTAAYKSLYNYAKTNLPKRKEGTRHATRYFYDVTNLSKVVFEWYTIEYPVLEK